MSEENKAPSGDRQNSPNNRRRRNRSRNRKPRQEGDKPRGGQAGNGTEGSKQQGRQPGYGRQARKRSNGAGKPQHKGSDARQSKNGRRSGGRSKQAPPKLTFFQKILSIFGLYKAPEPPRAKRQQKKFDEPREGKSRNRRKEGEGRQRKPRNEGEKRERKPRDKDRPRRERPKRTKVEPGSVTDGRLYVGNLSYEATEADLSDLFRGIGTVRRVEIVYNSHTHRSKGYAFVNMSNADDAQRGIEVLHDQFFLGRRMVVNVAKDRAEYETPDEPLKEQEAVRTENGEPPISTAPTAAPTPTQIAQATAAKEAAELAAKAEKEAQAAAAAEAKLAQAAEEAAAANAPAEPAPTPTEQVDVPTVGDPASTPEGAPDSEAEAEAGAEAEKPAQ